MNINQMNRRGFLKASALAGGGLMLELSLPTSVLGQDLGTLVGSKELNVYVQIASDGNSMFMCKSPLTAGSLFIQRIQKWDRA